MGMFDYLRCEAPRPDPAHQDLPFQTKDTPAQAMDTYVITADGRLLHERVRYEAVPEAERVAALVAAGHREEDARTGILAIAGRLRGVPDGVEEEPLHGDLCFYDLLTNGEPAWLPAPSSAAAGEEERPCPVRNPAYAEGWIEYVARFTEGRLARIWRQRPGEAGAA